MNDAQVLFYIEEMKKRAKVQKTNTKEEKFVPFNLGSK